jgi:hypothetical protein
MKDSRIAFFRSALDGLIESLDATLRLTRWVEEEGSPQSLRDSAALLVSRLGTADRLGASTFMGSPRDIVRVKAMCDAMRRLDVAYVAYHRQVGAAPGERQVAATTLESVMDKVRAEACAWA